MFIFVGFNVTKHRKLQGVWILLRPSVYTTPNTISYSCSQEAKSLFSPQTFPAKTTIHFFFFGFEYLKITNELPLPPRETLRPLQRWKLAESLWFALVSHPALPHPKEISAWPTDPEPDLRLSDWGNVWRQIRLERRGATWSTWWKADAPLSSSSSPSWYESGDRGAPCLGRPLAAAVSMATLKPEGLQRRWRPFCLPDMS